MIFQLFIIKNTLNNKIIDNHSFFIHFFSIKLTLTYLKLLKEFHIRILIFDNNLNDLNLLHELIKNMPIETLIDKVSTYNDFILLFKNHTYEQVFIDFMDPKGKDLAQYVKKNRPEQNLILLNEHYNCMYTHDCNSCKEHYNTHTLIKPITQNQIIKVITKNFECENYEKSELEFNLEKAKRVIHNNYPYVKVKDNQVLLASISDSLKTTALVGITDLLSKSSIQYELIDHQKIMIINK